MPSCRRSSGIRDDRFVRSALLSDRPRARCGLAIYLALVVALSAAIEVVVVSRPDIGGPFIAGLMWMPALASVVARLAR
jgi:hypothetical protein